MKVTSVAFEKRCRDPKDFPRFPLPEIAFVGRSNVGKSSLINTLLTRKRLVAVSSTPGKTRAIDFFRVNDAFRFVDLPGYGYAKVPEAVQRAWKKLIEAYLVKRETLASVVWILDIRREPSELDRMLYDWLRAHSIPYIPVCTKADKVSRGERARRKEALRRSLDPKVDLVLFSAKTGLGKDALWKRMRAAMLHTTQSDHSPKPPMALPADKDSSRHAADGE
jgi:GTP-binding protein